MSCCCADCQYSLVAALSIVGTRLPRINCINCVPITCSLNDPRLTMEWIFCQLQRWLSNIKVCPHTQPQGLCLGDRVSPATRIFRGWSAAYIKHPFVVGQEQDNFSQWQIFWCIKTTKLLCDIKFTLFSFGFGCISFNFTHI